MKKDVFDRMQDREGEDLLLDQYRRLFDNSNDPLFITDRELGIVQVNNAFTEFFQDPQLEGKYHLLDLVKKDKVREHVLDLIANGSIVNDATVQLTDKQGDRFHGVMSILPIKDEEEELIGYQGIIHNETAKVESTARMARAQKIALTGRMARVIAHEIRNPLTNIGLAVANLQEVLSEKQDVLLLNLIRNNCDRINSLLTDLLQSSSSSEPVYENVPIRTLVNESLALAKDRMELLGIDLHTDYPQEIVPVKVDELQVKLALNNLFINSIEAMSEGGELSVRLAFHAKYIVLSISDTGRGMDESELKNLFDPFYTTKPNGTGLGLTTVQNILSIHGWDIDVESEPGEGTTFYIQIPRSDSSDDKPVPRSVE